MTDLGTPIFPFMKWLILMLNNMPILWGGPLLPRREMPPLFSNIPMWVSGDPKISPLLVKMFLSWWFTFPIMKIILSPRSMLIRMIWKGPPSMFMWPCRGSFILPIRGVRIMGHPPRMFLSSLPHSRMGQGHPLLSGVPQLMTIFTPINIRVMPLLVRVTHPSFLLKGHIPFSVWVLPLPTKRV